MIASHSLLKEAFNALALAYPVSEEVQGAVSVLLGEPHLQTFRPLVLADISIWLRHTRDAVPDSVQAILTAIMMANMSDQLVLAAEHHGSIVLGIDEEDERAVVSITVIHEHINRAVYALAKINAVLTEIYETHYARAKKLLQ